MLTRHLTSELQFLCVNTQVALQKKSRAPGVLTVLASNSLPSSAKSLRVKRWYERFFYVNGRPIQECACRVTAFCKGLLAMCFFVARMAASPQRNRGPHGGWLTYSQATGKREKPRLSTGRNTNRKTEWTFEIARTEITKN